MSNVTDEKLQCLLLDEGKVVTYKFLSKHLKIHAHEAKVILSNFYQQYKCQYSLDAFYFVIGIQEENGSKGFKACLIPSAKLEDVKSSFSTAPSFHIYGVYKGKDLDINTLYAVDYEEGDKFDLNTLSRIHNPSVEIHSGKVTKPIPTNKVDVKSNSSVKSQPSNKHETKAPAAKSNNTDIVSIFQKKSNENKPGVKKESQKSDAKDGSPGTKSSENGVKEANTNKATNKNSLKNMFSNHSGKSSKVPNISSSVDSNVVQSSESEKGNKNSVKHMFSNHSGRSSKAAETSSSHDSDVVQTSEPKNAQKKRQPKRTKSNQSSRSEDSDCDSSKPKKKHKRIVAIEDSDSESENEEAKDMAQRNILSDSKTEEEKNENEDEEELIPPTPPSSNYKTMMKTVKTFTTDGEFLVTKKEKQCVTVPDEDFKPSNPKVFKEPVSKKVPFNKKQASLTSFFKQR